MISSRKIHLGRSASYYPNGDWIIPEDHDMICSACKRRVGMHRDDALCPPTYTDEPTTYKKESWDDYWEKSPGSYFHYPIDL